MTVDLNQYPHAMEVDSVTGKPMPKVSVSGTGTIADGADVAQGAKADAAVTDPTAVASSIALLKGLLTQLKDTLGVTIKGSEVMQAQDLQYRRSETIQTHTAVSITTNGWSNSAWLDSDGFDKVAVNLLNDASTSTEVRVEWSNDNATVHSYEVIMGAQSLDKRTAITDTKLRYFRIAVKNGDAVSHTMSAWAYLKV